MVKILSRSGDSLADTYDVQGSIAGIDQLESRELSIVHEMGATLFSERVSFFIRRNVTGNQTQNTSFNIIATDLPNTPTRLLSCTVLSDSSSRIANLAVLARNSSGAREVPIWVADIAAGTVALRLDDDGAGVVTFNLWRALQDLTYAPIFVGGIGQPQHVEELVLRGTTTGFGAGTVEITVLYYLAFSQVGGLSSRGLPVPSW